MRKTTAALVLCVPMLGVLPAAAATAGERAAAQARTLAEAAIALDAERVIALTHPRVYELTGNPDGAREQLRSAFASLKVRGLADEFGLRTLERVDFLPPGPPAKAGPGTLAVFIAYRAVERSREGRFAVESFYLGLSEDEGRRWRFVDGMGLDSQSMRLFAPGWTGAPPLPTRSRRRMP